MATVTIDSLIAILNRGGTVRTGVDIFSPSGRLLLEKDVLVTRVEPLLLLKKKGITDIPLNCQAAGGIWNESGRPLPLQLREEKSEAGPELSLVSLSLSQRIQEIGELKQESAAHYEKAKSRIKEVISELRHSGGELEMEAVESTVRELFDFFTEYTNAFAYLGKEIFSYDEYLFNHSLNVCIFGIAVLRRFNESFSEEVNRFLSLHSRGSLVAEEIMPASFIFLLPDDLLNIATGYFLHDLGKVLIPSTILDKKGPLTRMEFEEVKKHVGENGSALLEKNRLNNPFLANTVNYHHCALFPEEARCYPETKLPFEIPPYVKICKLVDIYDAMTSRRSYKEALNPVGVVTEIFRKYARKDALLQFILHAFVKVVGIYPPGGIVTLRNGVLAYVLDSEGPMVLPFTDEKGQPLSGKADLVDLAAAAQADSRWTVDRRSPLIAPVDAYNLLPSYLRKLIWPSAA